MQHNTFCKLAVVTAAALFGTYAQAQATTLDLGTGGTVTMTGATGTSTLTGNSVINGTFTVAPETAAAPTPVVTPGMPGNPNNTLPQAIVDNGDGTASYIFVNEQDASSTVALTNTTQGGLVADTQGNLTLSTLVTRTDTTNFEWTVARVQIIDGDGNVLGEFEQVGTFVADPNPLVAGWTPFGAAAGQSPRDVGGNNGDVQDNFCPAGAGMCANAMGDGIPDIVGVGVTTPGNPSAPMGGNLTVGGSATVTGNTTVTGVLSAVGGIAVDAASTSSFGAITTAGITNTGDLVNSGAVNTATLAVSGASTTSGITNTGNLVNSGAVNTATLAVSGASTTTGITNTGNLVNSGAVQTATLAVSGASTTTGITNTGNLVNSGAVQTATLVVSGASTTNGITNTGAVSTTTLAVSGAGTVGGAFSVSGPLAANGGFTAAAGSNQLSVGSSGVTASAGGSSLGLSAAGASLSNGGATVNLSGSNASLTNSSGHGVIVTASSTRISGGTASTNATFTDDAVVFDQDGTRPARVTGIANGRTQFDAVNFGQLEDTRETLARGIAATTAIANIPQVEQGKTFSLGGGIGGYDSEVAIAIGGTYRFNPTTVIKGSIGTGTSGSKPAFGFGIATSW